MKELANKINDALKGEGVTGKMAQLCIDSEDYYDLIEYWKDQVKCTNSKPVKLLGEELVKEIKDFKL